MTMLNRALIVRFVACEWVKDPGLRFRDLLTFCVNDAVGLTVYERDYVKEKLDNPLKFSRFRLAVKREMFSIGQGHLIFQD